MIPFSREVLSTWREHDEKTKTKKITVFIFRNSHQFVRVNNLD